MNKIVVTLIGLDNEVAGRVNIKLDGLDANEVILPDVQLVELEAPVVVRGVQINGVPAND